MSIMPPKKVQEDLSVAQREGRAARGTTAMTCQVENGAGTPDKGSDGNAWAKGLP